MKPFIEIKKQRNIDTIIEDSFKFFRLYIKEMLKIVWEQNRILLTLLIITYFLNSYYSFDIFNKLQQIKTGNINSLETQNSVISTVVSLVLILLSVVFIPRFFSAIAGYMQLYNKNRGQVDAEEVKQIVNDKFWGLIGLFFTLLLLITLVIILIAFIFTYLAKLGAPGVFLIIAISLPLVLYAIVYLSLVFYVYFFDNIDMSIAISRTASYIKERFWFSLGVIIIMVILVMLISSVVNIPIYIYMGIKGVSLVSKSVSEISQPGDVFISIYSVVSYLAQLVLRMLTIISMVFLYFSLREYHTNESLFEKIDEIGNDDADTQI